METRLKSWAPRLSREEALALTQNSEEWRNARAGSMGASQIADMVRTVKSGGYSASRDNLKSLLVVERLTGKPVNHFVSYAMQQGTEREPQGRAMYELMLGVDVVQVGIAYHPEIVGTHSSCDGLVGRSGLVEIKAPEHKEHIRTLLDGKIQNDYVLQCQWQLACADRQWVDFVSFNPDFPVPMQLFRERIVRDDAMIADLEEQAVAFLAEVAATVDALRRRFPS